MTKKKIYDIFSEFYKNPSRMRELTNELLGMFEQEKKEVAREMLVKIIELFPTDKNFTAISRTTIKALAKEYEVEL